MQCSSCITMDYGVTEGIPRDFIEYDFVAEDALEFELQLAEARDVKFTQLLSEPVSIGTHITCTGTPVEDIPWFAINIGCGDVESAWFDTAVHFNVRMPQCYVVRNTKRHDKWGLEETTSFKSFPFKMGQTFTIEVLVDEKETLWSIDGSHYCSYAHRNPSPLAANWIQVVGVRDAELKVQKADAYPKLLVPKYPEVPTRPSIVATAVNEPVWSPHATATLTNGLPEGHQIVIRGRLRPMLHSFVIDLTDSVHEWPHANIHAHINLRAHDNSQKDRQLVVLNAWLGAWGPERRQRTARLVPGAETTFRIVRNPGEWSVYNNNILIGELEYRSSPQGVKALRIRGDLYPDTIYICPSSNSPTREDC